MISVPNLFLNLSFWNHCNDLTEDLKILCKIKIWFDAFLPCERFIAFTHRHPLSGLISRSIHALKEKGYMQINLVWCHSPETTLSTLNGITRNKVSVVCAKQEKTILTAEKEQYFTSQIPSLTKVEHDKAMKLLAYAWSENLLPQFLPAASITFSEIVACISRGSFKMPGRTKITKMIDEFYEDMMMKLKDMYIAITVNWISSDLELLSVWVSVMFHILQRRLRH